MKLKIVFSFLAVMIALPVMAQTPDVVAMPDPDDFLVDTYSMPADPVSVPAVPAIPNTTPVSSNKDILTEIFGSNAVTLNADQPVASAAERNFAPIPGMYYPKRAILTKLPDLPPPQQTYERYVDTKITPVIRQPSYADELLEATEQGKDVFFSAPREVRIKFYPGQSNISAQAIKWIKSFALKVRDDPRLVVEIRASEEDWPLQRKRLALMLQIILEQGVSRHQIVIYRSARSVDTVLLGCGRSINQEVQMNKKRQKTITW